MLDRSRGWNFNFAFEWRPVCPCIPENDFIPSRADSLVGASYTATPLQCNYRVPCFRAPLRSGLQRECFKAFRSTPLIADAPIHSYPDFDFAADRIGFDISVLDNSLFYSLVFNCAGFSYIGLPKIGFSRLGSLLSGRFKIRAVPTKFQSVDFQAKCPRSFFFLPCV